MLSWMMLIQIIALIVHPWLSSCSPTPQGQDQTAIHPLPGAPYYLSRTAGPHSNYFVSTKESSVQLVVTSPTQNDNLTYISPRILAAWPAGNAGIAAFFKPMNGLNGTLQIKLADAVHGIPILEPIYETNNDSDPTVGLSTELEFSSAAYLSTTILSSVRAIRDFVEGPSLLHEELQEYMGYDNTTDAVTISRKWLDEEATMTLSFQNRSPHSRVRLLKLHDDEIHFEPGTYTMNASYNYIQMPQLSAQELLKPAAFQPIDQEARDDVDLLSFLSYSSKLTAGGWRFLTYFGRDSMISALLLEDILSDGEGGAMEAVLSSVIERVNKADGSVCHEETIGEYATLLNRKEGLFDPERSYRCDYGPIDTDFFLPILLERYLVRNPVGALRAVPFLWNTRASYPENRGLTYRSLVDTTAKKIVRITEPFTKDGGQLKANLLTLKADAMYGQWRDSVYGLGGGRIPFDVNTALAPAALRAIASLSKAGFLDFNTTVISQRAKIWEDGTLPLFKTTVAKSVAQNRLSEYVQTPESGGVKSSAHLVDDDIQLYALALDGHDGLPSVDIMDLDDAWRHFLLNTTAPSVDVMHSDDAFRHFLLNTTDQTQLTSFLNTTALNVQRRFPAGLMTDVGMIVANPAYSADPIHAKNFTNSAYHGTVVWSWQLALMAKGLEKQLSRCSDSSTEVAKPAFCIDTVVFSNVKRAYNTLWDSIDANKKHLNMEVWTWKIKEPETSIRTWFGLLSVSEPQFEFVDMSTLPPPPGTNPVEANIVQLWSLTFLAVKRNSAFGMARVEESTVSESTVSSSSVSQLQATPLTATHWETEVVVVTMPAMHNSTAMSMTSFMGTSSMI